MRTIAERLVGQAAVVQINTKENPGLAGRFGVRSIPVILLLRNGKVVDQLAGAQPVDSVVGWFQQKS